MPALICCFFLDSHGIKKWYEHHKWSVKRGI